MANYIQPDYRNPTPNASVTVQVESKTNPLALSYPLPIFIEKLSDKDDPHGTARAGKSGKGSPG